jgi:hypothetical protein
VAGVGLGVFLGCGHGPQDLFVEAVEDESAEGAGDGGMEMSRICQRVTRVLAFSGSKE